MAITHHAALIALVRLTSTNKSLRIKQGGVDSTVTFPEGVYWLGLNGDANAPDDSTIIPGVTSLLEQWTATTGIGRLRLQYLDQPDADVTDAATGHVWCEAQAAADKVYWANAATTVDPAWFGQVKSGNAYADTTFAGTTAVDISQASSSLAWVPPPPIRAATIARRFQISRGEIQRHK
mgnify:FL=1